MYSLLGSLELVLLRFELTLSLLISLIKHFKLFQIVKYIFWGILAHFNIDLLICL